MSILGGQLVECPRGCNRTVKAENYNSHIQSQCQAFFEHSVLSPSRTTIRDLLDRDRESATTPTEKRVAQHLIKRLMAENEEGQLLQLPTRGQVCIQTHESLTYKHLCVADLFAASEKMQS